MLTNPTLEKLNALKLYGMAKAYEDQAGSPLWKGLSFEEKIGLMTDRELTERENRRMQVRLRQAKLRQQACMEDIDYKEARGLDKSLVSSFASCRWIKERLNILITGPTGSGKSYLACALGHRACLEGYSVLYFRSSRLFQELALGKGDGRYGKIMRQIAKANLLIIDDWGLNNLSQTERNELLEIMEDRHQNQSTIIASQLPLKNWHDAIGNQTIADAILDRLVHNAYKLNLKGDSMRKNKKR